MPVICEKYIQPHGKVKSLVKLSEKSKEAEVRVNLSLSMPHHNVLMWLDSYHEYTFSLHENTFSLHEDTFFFHEDMFSLHESKIPQNLLFIYKAKEEKKWGN